MEVDSELPLSIEARFLGWHYMVFYMVNINYVVLYFMMSKLVV